jgi:hypothetical protein
LKKRRAERITVSLQLSADRSVEFSLERKRRDRWEVASRYPGEKAWTHVKSVSGSVSDVVLWCETTYFSDPEAPFRKREANLRAFGNMLGNAVDLGRAAALDDFFAAVTPLVDGSLTRDEASRYVGGVLHRGLVPSAEAVPSRLSLAHLLHLLRARLPDPLPEGHGDAWNEGFQRARSLEQALNVLKGKLKRG